jgi:hypothetical protein
MQQQKHPRFCVDLNVNEGWVTSIALNYEDVTLPTQNVMVDYDSVPFRCRACLSWKHRVKE